MTTGEPQLAPDAELVLGLASTAMPFARTPAAQAERWLRILAEQGEVGGALHELGLSDHPTAGTAAADDSTEHPEDTERLLGADVIANVTDIARRLAAEREAHEVSTTDVLFAVTHVYGSAFEHVLSTHGVELEQLIESLAAANTRPDA